MDPSTNIFPSSTKEPKKKDKNKHNDHKLKDFEPSGHASLKKMKQQMLYFSTAYRLANILAMTNGGSFTNEFVLSHLIDLKLISDHGRCVLNKSDDNANWVTFWAFQAQAPTIAQHLKGSSMVNKLKVDLNDDEDDEVHGADRCDEDH